MTDETNDELVEVSVPRRHLIAVYGLLAELEGARHASGPGAELSVDGQPAGEIPWSADDLKRFASTPTATSFTIRQVLDVLAEEPGKFFSTSTLEQRTGIPRANLKGAFSGLSRHVRKYYPNRVPMTVFAWGTNMGPDVPAEAHYMLDEERAATWKQAVAGLSATALSSRT